MISPFVLRLRESDLKLLISTSLDPSPEIEFTERMLHYLKNFREFLGLTTREFATVFEFSHSSLNAFEKGRTSGKDI